jgi:MoaA/NifB/PqqE/SkfB family radical SAM enzyme
MTPQDVITFSIDGLAHNNHLYRINSDWKSIMDGLEIMVSGPAKTIWKTIVFSHNQHQIKEIEELAYSMGVDEFRLIKTSRFGEEKFRPDEQYIDASRLYENSFRRQVITPKCASIHPPLITPDGYCWPCCWISSYFTLHKTDIWKNRHLFDMKTCNMEQVINNISSFAETVKNNPEQAHSVCKMHCGNVD